MRDDTALTSRSFGKKLLVTGDVFAERDRKEESSFWPNNSTKDGKDGLCVVGRLVRNDGEHADNVVLSAPNRQSGIER